MRSRNLFFFIAATLAADECYYPNGKLASDVMCEGGSGMCCPNQWLCLNNGLCHYTPSNEYGRYTCTDKSWESEGCPSICVTHSPEGDEAVLQCKDGSWCCDYDHPEYQKGGQSCCDQDPSKRETFDFGDGTVFAAIGDAPSAVPSTSALGKASSSSQNSASQPTSSSSSPNVVAGPPHVTSRDSSSTSGAPGNLSSASLPNALSSTGLPSPTSLNGRPSPDSIRKLPLILSITIGVPTVLGIVGGLAYWGWIHRKESMAKREQRQADSYDFSQGAAEKRGLPSDGQTPFSSAEDRPGSVMAPSEIDSREIRVPISPQDTEHLSPNSGNFTREETTNTLYPNTRPNYSNTTSPTMPQSPTTSTIMTNPPDYSEWGLTPRLEQHRWSGTTAQESAGLGVHMGATSSADEQPQELMGRPRIPSTIAELP